MVEVKRRKFRRVGIKGQSCAPLSLLSIMPKPDRLGFRSRHNASLLEMKGLEETENAV